LGKKRVVQSLKGFQGKRLILGRQTKTINRGRGVKARRDTIRELNPENCAMMKRLRRKTDKNGSGWTEGANRTKGWKNTLR